MPRQFTQFPLRQFGTLTSTRDTVDVGGGALVTADNAILRPAGAVRGGMFYERLWGIGAEQASVTVTVSSAEFTRAAHGLVLDTVVRFSTTDTLPTGLAADTDYYVVVAATANTFEVSATSGGSSISTSGGAGTLSYTATITRRALYRSLQYLRLVGYVDADADTLYLEAHNLAVNDIVQFTTTGTLPAGLSLATDYYVKAVPSSDSITLSDSLGGSIVDITDDGTGIHTLTLSAGVGSTSSLQTRFQTVAAHFARQGKNFLALYDLVGDKGRGVFYMGDDGSYSGAYAFATGDPTSTVLAVGLDSDAMWFGARNAGLLMIQNGVDDSVAIQLDRTSYPGKWRKCGDNAIPATPTVSLVAPASAENVQAFGYLPSSLVFTADAGTDLLTVTGMILEDQHLGVATTGTMPDGMIGLSSVYAGSVTYTAATNTSTFKVRSTYLDPVIDLLDAGSGTHTLWAYNGTGTATPESVTFTVNPDFKQGASGNETVRVVLAQTASVVATKSTLTGLGTTGDPFVYTVTAQTDPAFSGVDAIVAFINADSKVIGILSAAKSGADATVSICVGGPSLLLQNGSGTGVSVGFTNRTVTIYLRYFDSGISNFGYEGASSVISEEYYITETANSDVLVTIDPAPEAGSGRFDQIRVYMQFGEGADAIWSLMGYVANTAGTKSLQIGTATEIGQGLSEFDQNRPLPHKAIVSASSRTWRGGLRLSGFRNRLYISKEATDDEAAPEGVGLEGYEIIDVPEATVQIEVRALYSDLYRIHVHTNAGIMVIDPANVGNSPHRPGVNVGAINPSCFGSGPNNAIIYIGQDIQPYNFNGNRYGKRDVRSAAREAEAIIRATANVDSIGQNADKVTSFQDKSGLLWWFFPDTTSTIKGMCLDIERSGLLGPFDYPRAVSSCMMESERPEILMQDETGNLFIYDITAQTDTGADLPAVATLAPIATTITPAASYDGFPYTDYNSLRYLNAVWTVLETGMIDLGDTGHFKQFNGISFRPVSGSRGIVVATLKGITSGKEVTRTFGEMGEFTDIGPKRIFMNLSDSAVSLKLEILGAESKPWIIRDVTLLYRG